MPARFTIDMYRLPDLSAAEVTVTPIREGRRIKVIDAEYSVGGSRMARATCRVLRKSENPKDGLDAAQLGCPEARRYPSAGRTTASMGGMWATRPISGGFGTVGQKRSG